jgi:uncharacterized membrane protein YidH (DUF202 family)
VTAVMKRMPSQARAERNQRRKLQYFPPIWPLLAVIALVVVIVVAVRHG